MYTFAHISPWPTPSQTLIKPVLQPSERCASESCLLISPERARDRGCTLGACGRYCIWKNGSDMWVRLLRELGSRGLYVPYAFYFLYSLLNSWDLLGKKLVILLCSIDLEKRQSESNRTIHLSGKSAGPSFPNSRGCWIIGALLYWSINMCLCTVVCLSLLWWCRH